MPFIQVISIFQIFLGNSNKSALDASAQSLFIVLKDHKSAEATTLTRESCENVVCQTALEQGYEIENVAATEGTDFSCKPAQLVITKFVDCGSKKELLSGLEHVYITDLHLKLIDLDGNKGIIFCSYFGTDYSYLVTMSFICSFNKNCNVLRSRFK